jgi:two-component system alkaline phosphatase synthesis response regulator PhoP
MNWPTILIVEDEPNLGETLVEYLGAQGHRALLAQTARDADLMFKDHHPGIVLMDIGLPDGDGLVLARAWRGKRKDFALLFLSALNDPETRVEGLEIGAHDYITKPFALKELMLRLDRTVRTLDFLKGAPDEIAIGPLRIWFKRFEVRDAMGVTHTLSQKENAILELLYRRKNEAVERDEIIEDVWGSDKFPSNRTVDNYIVKLRKWCESDPEEHIDIQSIRGIGYKLTVKD